MKKLILLVLFVIGCDNATEPNVNKTIRGIVVDGEGNTLSDAAILLQYELAQISEGLMRSQMPTTTINFTILTESYVLFWIESICGDTLNILVDGNKNAGSYSITWDSSDGDGNMLVDGVYIASMNYTSIENQETINQKQKISLITNYGNHLEILNGVLGYTGTGSTVQDTFYTYNYHAMTDSEGYFSIPFDCLSFDSGTQMGMDESGNTMGTWEIAYKTKLWIVNEGNPTFTTDWYDVDPNTGLEVTIQAPY